MLWYDASNKNRTNAEKNADRCELDNQVLDLNISKAFGIIFFTTSSSGIGG